MADQQTRSRKPVAFYLVAALLLAGLMFAACVLFRLAPFHTSFLEGSGWAMGAVLVIVLFAAAAAFYLLTRLTVLWFPAPLCVAAVCGVVYRSYLPFALFCFGTALSAAIAFCIRKRKNRLFCAAVGALVIALFLATLSFVCAYETIGMEGLSRSGAYLADAKSEIHRFFAEFSASWDALLQEQDLADRMPALNLNEQTVERIIKLTVLSLPGYFVSLCLALSFAASFIVRLILKRARVLSSMYPDGFYAYPSLVGAIVFAACLALSALSGDAVSVLAYTAANLCSILSLVFAAAGLGVLGRRFSARRRFPAGTLLILAVLAFLWLGGAGLYRGPALAAMLASLLLFVSGVLYPVLYVLGLFSTILRAVRKRREKSS